MTAASGSQATRLRITEIFCSLQGESRFSGLPTVFIRLTGCPLRCGYCDTEYAFQGGQWMSLDEILTRTAEYGVTHVTVTGGEPLAQKACPELLRALCDHGYVVSLETSGALPVADVDPRVARIVDLKTPGSGEQQRNLLENIDYLGPQDELKFVITDRADYEWAREQLRELALAERCGVLFSPAAGSIAPKDLAQWILEDKLPVRFQIQLHKVLWGDRPGH